VVIHPQSGRDSPRPSAEPQVLPQHERNDCLKNSVSFSIGFPSSGDALSCARSRLFAELGSKLFAAYPGSVIQKRLTKRITN
jgi:hypothetical protein